jgi:hypothetical protein
MVPGSIPGQRTALEIPSLGHKECRSNLTSEKSGIRHLAGTEVAVLYLLSRAIVLLKQKTLSASIRRRSVCQARS